MISTKINIINNAEIQKNGIAALKEALGVTGTLKFLEQFDRGGCGDYTAEKYLSDGLEPTDEEMRVALATLSCCYSSRISNRSEISQFRYSHSFIIKFASIR